MNSKRIELTMSALLAGVPHVIFMAQLRVQTCKAQAEKARMWQ